MEVGSGFIILAAKAALAIAREWDDMMATGSETYKLQIQDQSGSDRNMSAH